MTPISSYNKHIRCFIFCKITKFMTPISLLLKVYGTWLRGCWWVGNVDIFGVFPIKNVTHEWNVRDCQSQSFDPGKFLLVGKRWDVFLEQIKSIIQTHHTFALAHVGCRSLSFIQHAFAFWFFGDLFEFLVEIPFEFPIEIPLESSIVHVPADLGILRVFGTMYVIMKVCLVALISIIAELSWLIVGMVISTRKCRRGSVRWRTVFRTITSIARTGATVTVRWKLLYRSAHRRVTILTATVRWKLL